ncbi:hypothetical protein AN1V17_21030 [Vallitalea sediminicola]
MTNQKYLCNIIKELLLINIKKGGSVMIKIRIVKDMINQSTNGSNSDKYKMTLPQIVD